VLFALPALKRLGATSFVQLLRTRFLFWAAAARALRCKPMLRKKPVPTKVARSRANLPPSSSDAEPFPPPADAKVPLGRGTGQGRGARGAGRRKGGEKGQDKGRDHKRPVTDRGHAEASTTKAPSGRGRTAGLDGHASARPKTAVLRDNGRGRGDRGRGRGRGAEVANGMGRGRTVAQDATARPTGPSPAR